MANPREPKCRNLVLDTGPLLSLSPLRGLASTFFTVPQVLAELKDNRTREHFERLGLLSGVKVEIRSPDAASLSHVIQWAKKTGDYSVLSHPDLCVLALTYMLEQEEKIHQEIGKESKQVESTSTQESIQNSESTATATVTVEGVADQLERTSLQEDEYKQGDNTSPDPEENLDPLEVELERITPTEQTAPIRNLSPEPLFEDPSDSDDGEGEWITPENVGIYKSRALDLLPDDGLKGKGRKDATIGVGCITADFAMQNVLLQMGLNLVGLEGRRIEKIKNWVLRCHACFKICKDNSKKFCPSCGNPTLLRASVTVAAPNASVNAPVMQVHLKPNFQYKTRGTKYSIPQPKPGSAKSGPGTGLILREDQVEYMRAKKRADGKKQKEEERLVKGILSKGFDSAGNGTAVSSWMDPDWVPEIISVGSGGKGRTTRRAGMDGDMPQIGYGRKNPNEKRRKK